MSKKYLIPFALILILVLVACGGQQTAEPDAAAAEEAMGEMKDGNDEAMDESHDGDMDEMDEGHDDAMTESSDEMASMEKDQEADMDESHEGDMDDDASMDDSESMEKTDSETEMAMEDKDESMEASSETMMDLPAWQTFAVTNAATGESFKLGDFQGKTVFVEPMATWCSNCRTQQGHVQQAKAQLGNDVVFVGLSLETTLPAADLAGYAQGNGFDWTYAVMSEELLKGLADAFGRSITSAPSTPHFIISPDGSFSELSTGIHSAEEIIAQVQEAQS